MRNHFEKLRRDPEPRLRPPYPPEYFGDPVAGGTLDTNEGCWDVAGDLRTLYYTTIHPKLLERLFAIFGTASISDWITLPVYMVGQNRTNALPTVMVCSEDEVARKRAKKELRKSPFLKEHAKFKVISVPTDPSIQGALEQLASDTAGEKPVGPPKRATKVLIDKTKPLHHLGVEIWVDHGSSLRPATAFATQVEGRTCLRTVDHAFVATATSAQTMTTTSNHKLPIQVDSDSDSDTDSDDEDELNVAITSIGSQSPDAWSSEGSDGESTAPSVVFSGRSTPSTHDQVTNTTTPFDIRDISSRLAPFSSLPKRFPPKQIVQPSKEKLVSLGSLTFSSVDKDWALIEITNEDMFLRVEQSISGHPLPCKSLPGPKEDAQVVACTASSGTLTGSFTGVPFCTRLPNSSSFQDVYRVRLNGPLANGDCGSPVKDAATGELYGHIVAGCRSTGTAYIMAAHQIEADLTEIELGSKMEGPGGSIHNLNDIHTRKAQFSVSKRTEDAEGRLPQQLGYTQERRKVPEETPEPTTPRQNGVVLTPDKNISDAARKVPVMRHPNSIAHVGTALQDDTPASDLNIGETTFQPKRAFETTFGFGVGVLYWTANLCSILLPLLVFRPKQGGNNSTMVSLHATRTYSGLLLGFIVSGLLSVSLGVFLNRSFAVIKVAILVSLCIVGCLIHLLGDPVSTILGRLYRHRSARSSASTEKDISSLTINLSNSRDKFVSVTLNRLDDVDWYWSSDHSDPIFHRLGLDIVAIIGILSTSTVIYFFLKRRKRRNLKQLLGFTAQIAAILVTMLWITTAWNTLTPWTHITNKLSTLNDTAWMIPYTELVLLMVPGIGLFYSGLARRRSSLSRLSRSAMNTVIVTSKQFLCGYLPVLLWFRWLSFNGASSPRAHSRTLSVVLASPGYLELLDDWLCEIFYSLSVGVLMQTFSNLVIVNYCVVAAVTFSTLYRVSERIEEMTSLFPSPSWYRSLFSTPLKLFIPSYCLKVGLKMKLSFSHKILSIGSAAKVPMNMEPAFFRVSEFSVGGYSRNPCYSKVPESMRQLLGAHFASTEPMASEMALGLSATSVLLMWLSLTLVLHLLNCYRHHANGHSLYDFNSLRIAVSVVYLGLIFAFSTWLGHNSYSLGSTIDRLTARDSRQAGPDHWQLGFLSFVLSGILGMCLVYAMRESPRWFIKPNRYKRALETAHRTRSIEIASCNGESRAYFQIEAERLDRRLSRNPVAAFWSIIILLCFWAGLMAITESVSVKQFTCFGVVTLLAISTRCVANNCLSMALCTIISSLQALDVLFCLQTIGMETIPFDAKEDKTSTKIVRPLLMSVFESYTGLLICVSLHRLWKLHTNLRFGRIFQKRKGLKVDKTPRSDLTDILAEREIRPRSFVPSMSHNKALIGFTTCIAVVIGMGINSFLIKEVENWKRMSFGVSPADIVVLCGFAQQICMGFASQAYGIPNPYAALSEDISRLQEVIGNLERRLEEDSCAKSLGAGDQTPHQGSDKCPITGNLADPSSFKRKHDRMRHQDSFEDTARQYEENCNTGSSSSNTAKASVMTHRRDHWSRTDDRVLIGRGKRQRPQNSCAVCEEPLEHTLRGERILQLSCGHASHEACFHEYLREFEAQHCPICNATICDGDVLAPGKYQAHPGWNGKQDNADRITRLRDSEADFWARDRITQHGVFHKDRATSAAPTYFESLGNAYPKSDFIDGALNCPIPPLQPLYLPDSLVYDPESSDLYYFTESSLGLEKCFSFREPAIDTSANTPKARIAKDLITGGVRGFSPGGINIDFRPPDDEWTCCAQIHSPATDLVEGNYSTDPRGECRFIDIEPTLARRRKRIATNAGVPRNNFNRHSSPMAQYAQFPTPYRTGKLPITYCAFNHDPGRHQTGDGCRMSENHTGIWSDDGCIASQTPDIRPQNITWKSRPSRKIYATAFTSCRTIHDTGGVQPDYSNRASDNHNNSWRGWTTSQTTDIWSRIMTWKSRLLHLESHFSRPLSSTQSQKIWGAEEALLSEHALVCMRDEENALYKSETTCIHQKCEHCEPVPPDIWNHLRTIFDFNSESSIENYADIVTYIDTLISASSLRTRRNRAEERWMGAKALHDPGWVSWLSYAWKSLFGYIDEGLKMPEEKIGETTLHGEGNCVVEDIS